MFFLFFCKKGNHDKLEYKYIIKIRLPNKIII